MLHDVRSFTGPVSSCLRSRRAGTDVRRVLAAAGGTAGDIVKCTVFVQDKAIRPVVDKYWVEMFPYEASRPARHMLRTDLWAGTRLQLEIMAVLGPG
jgi:2-iminobutanoate/2-iminopropanoate deaminase